MKMNDTMPWNTRDEIFVINCGKADLDSHLFFYLCQNILKSVYTSYSFCRTLIYTIWVFTKTIRELAKVGLFFKLENKERKKKMNESGSEALTATSHWILWD